MRRGVSGRARANHGRAIMNRQARSCRTVLIVLLLLPVSASLAQEPETPAGALRLHLNGFALHSDKGKDTNQQAWGLGIEKSSGTSKSKKAILNGWHKYWELNVYKDSYSDMAVAGGFGVYRPVFRYLDFGFKIGLLYEKEYKEKAGSYIIPYLLPSIQTRFDTRLNLRATVVPPFPAYSIKGLIFLQLIVDIP